MGENEYKVNRREKNYRRAEVKVFVQYVNANIQLL